ncbi:acyl-CoA dehydrogenase family protein [Mycolicibacterium fluoranthenivorans]|uniref:Alkylation response protein AidB-like acyl-CoA dehydrogenase n=1 Tax=Mycolicibacterium fluoranthenivorans TaxID=258505 RepID=A0A7X5U1U9_9MYCO|nr:acyl-CoA dehydrogenase family protein [Mycolicibacterium fluoranthenivorans]MCV7359597.1 acyl-CoA dehydrogenase [Mycolicibacterium fluoranthenivorans]NIH96873.1 alkylation response protein AidB-like acyl-CoA dehydrogenase [Mycolicibacterium fluoranthenivorans]
MLLEFDADQRLWQETVRDAVGKQCPASLVRGIAENKGAPEAAHALWQSYLDAGWTELADPENAVELAIVLEELGRATDPTPFLATLSQFAPLAGKRFDPSKAGAAVYDGVSANWSRQGWVLEGTSKFVLDGDRAEQIAVVTPAGVFVIDGGVVNSTEAPGITSRRRDVFDPVLHVAEVTFDRLRVEEPDRLDLEPSAASALVERSRHIALMGLAITMVGACQRVLDLALEHAKSRQQFGVPIGSFQAIQHKATDMYVAIERARALSYFSALTIAADDPRRRIAAAMAKASAGECQSLVFQHGLQTFGAMGFTWENDLQFALKRAKAGELLLGGAAEHRALIAEEFDATRI